MWPDINECRPQCDTRHGRVLNDTLGLCTPSFAKQSSVDEWVIEKAITNYGRCYDLGLDLEQLTVVKSSVAEGNPSIGLGK